MSDIVGQYYSLERRLDKVRKAQSADITSRIGPIVARQVELRGEGKRFRFKAFGLRWLYVPEGK